MNENGIEELKLISGFLSCSEQDELVKAWAGAGESTDYGLRMQIIMSAITAMSFERNTESGLRLIRNTADILLQAASTHAINQANEAKETKEELKTTQKDYMACTDNIVIDSAFGTGCIACNNPHENHYSYLTTTWSCQQKPQLSHWEEEIARCDRNPNCFAIECEDCKQIVDFGVRKCPTCRVYSPGAPGHQETVCKGNGDDVIGV